MAIKTLTAKGKTSWQKEKYSQQNFFDAERTFFILLSFAVRLFFLTWGYSFSLSIFLFAVRLLFLPWGFSFCPEVFLFALRLIILPWQSAGPPYLWNSVHKDSWFFFSMWVFVRTSTKIAHLVSFHYSSHRIRGLARSENTGHFCTCMSDKWKQSFQNAAFCNCCSRRARTRFNLVT